MNNNSISDMASISIQITKK